MSQDFYTTNDDLDLDVDTDVDTDDTDGDVIEIDASEPTTDTKPRAKAAGKRRSGLSAAQVRRVVAKTLAVQESDVSTRALAAAALGVEDDTVDLVAAILTATKATTVVFDDIADIAGADPMEAVVIAASHDRDRLRAMHRVLQSVGAADSATLNPADVKAGMTIAKAAQALTDQQSSELMFAAALISER